MRTLLTALSLLVLASLALSRWERGLRGAHESRRLARLRIGRVFEQDADTGRVAALSVQLPRRPELVYARDRGRWRCLSAFGAPVRAGAVEEIIAGIESATGLLRSSGPGARAFGFDSAESSTLRLHGPGLLSAPQRDLLRSLELAAPQAGSEFSFLRASAAREVFEVRTPWRRALAWPPERTLPPLLDDRLLAASWPAGRPEWTRLFVDLSGGDSLELRAEGTGAARRWRLRSAASQPEAWSDVLPYRMTGYLTFLVRARYQGVADPRERAALGCDPAWARLTLVAEQGEPVQLEIGVAGANGSFVWNAASRCLLQASDPPALLAPTREMFLDGTAPNPWERWLSR